MAMNVEIAKLCVSDSFFACVRLLGVGGRTFREFHFQHKIEKKQCSALRS
jgi:hypothetical protein